MTGSFEPSTLERPRIRREIFLFLAITFLLSACFYLLTIRLGGLAAGGAPMVLGLMWSPGVAALLTQLISRRTVRGLLWGFGRPRYLALGYLTPVAYAAVVYGVVWLTGLGGIDGEAAGAIGSRIWWLLPLGSLQSCLFALGEEIGWRGLFFPRLHQLFGFRRAAVVSGLVWAVWHYPLILWAGYNSGTPRGYAVVCFTVLVVGISFFYGWITLRSGSVWPAVLLHGSHNLWIQGFFDPLTVDTGATEWVIGEFGIGLALVSIPVAWLALKLWRSGRGPTAREA